MHIQLESNIAVEYGYIYIHNYICMSIQSIFPPNNPPNVTPLSRTPSPGETLKREPTPFSESLDPVVGTDPVVHRVPWLGAWCFRLQRRTGRERLGCSGEAVAKGAAVTKKRECDWVRSGKWPNG